jgi:hypothetical protein
LIKVTPWEENLNKSQISYANKFNTERFNIKELAKKLQNSNKNKSSTNNTIDTSIPEVRLMKEIFPEKKVDYKNNTLSPTNEGSMHSKLIF